MADINLQEVHDALIAIALDAGQMIIGANVNDISTGTKLNSVDIVTETDQAVEKLVSTKLQSLFPNYLFVGEETYVAGETKITDAPTFIVDPIDGTTNFIHGFPNACISLGFVVNKVPSVGVVFNPFQNLLFTGIKGQGSFLHRGGIKTGVAKDINEFGEKLRLPLSLSRTSAAASSSKSTSIDKTVLPALVDLSTSLLAIEWGSSRDGANYDIKADTFRKLCASKETGGAMVHSLRSLGSAALNLCATAAGQVDMYWEGGCYAWDVAAGWCILVEAGGMMVSGNGPTDQAEKEGGDDGWTTALDSRVYLAVRGAPEEGQRKVVEEFWGVVGGRKMVYEH